MRLYRLAPHLKDGELAENSRTLRLLFLDKASEFEAFDPTMNTAYTDDWLLAIQQFERHQSDENTLDVQQQYTLDLADATEKALGLVRGLEYYIEQAYPGQEYMKAEFGIDAMARRRKTNYDEVVTACKVIHTLLLEDQAVFLAVGMSPAFAGNFWAAIQEVETLLLNRNTYMVRRQRLTRKRIEMFNHLYGIHRQVAKAARVIYAHDPINIDLFTKL